MNSPKPHLTNFPPKPSLFPFLSKLTSPNSIRFYSLDGMTCHYPNLISTSSKISSSSSPSAQPSHSSALMASGVGPTDFQGPPWGSHHTEELIEKAIYRFRFVTILGVFGSLIGSVLCFIKGCNIVASSFIEHFARSGKVMVLLVEAIDVYLLGTVMLVFGMGLYELFVSNLDIAKSQSDPAYQNRSNLFGLFTLLERPKWLEIKTVNELKTKVGHVIVMLLLIGFFDKSKKAAINSPSDLLCFAASVLLCSGCLYLLSMLNVSK